MQTIDAPYLPLVIQEAAGIPLDPSFEEQKNIMMRCKGVFYACKSCLLYTSDAADERSSVDLGGRRIIKKKKQKDQ